MASSRAIAAEILVSVIDSGQSLTPLLEARLSDLPDNERAFTSALCYGCLRYYQRLDSMCSALMTKSLKAKDRNLHMLLIGGIYQLAYMTKPAHAAINETVNVARELDKNWATKLLNGVLRNFVRKQTELEAYADQKLETRVSFPGWLAKTIMQAYPLQGEALMTALNQQAPMTLRINCAQSTVNAYAEQLITEGIESVPTKLSQYGLTLKSPCDVSLLPGFFQPGLCSVQDEAAQLASQLLGVKSGHRILDACSAPGGKTAAILEQTRGEAHLVAVDLDAGRQERTKQTLQRLGLEAEVLVADTADLVSWWDGMPFDRILLDAPCSATGVIRRHPDIKHLRRMSDISQLSEIQLKLLHRLWETLKPGGRILYATCSILPQENMHIIERFMQEQPHAKHLPLIIECIESFQDESFGVQILPSEGSFDGFFYALLEKSQA